MWKHLSRTRVRLREEHPTDRLAFPYERTPAAGLGLVRSAQRVANSGPVSVQVLDGLGYCEDAATQGACPTDPYSHMPGEGGARQPRMTGHVKEEILIRWGEQGLRVQGGRVRFYPVLLDTMGVPEAGALAATWARVP